MLHFTSARLALFSAPALALLHLVSAVPAADAQQSLALGGVNLAGLEFGMDIQGTLQKGKAEDPPAGQVKHFADRGANLFRIPFAWQAVQDAPGSDKLIEEYRARLDKVVTEVLEAGAYAIIDCHNYGRWDGKIIGKDGPSAADFAKLWGALAKHYSANEKVMFGLMNEPHDQEISDFKAPLQEAVNAIREAGAKSHYILLPGSGWSHASEFIKTNKAVLTTITDPAGGNAKLLYDLHEYLDGDGSGQSTECQSDKAELWDAIGKDLKADGRQAIVTEIGGGSTESCKTHLKSALAKIRGAGMSFAAWSAGAFDQADNYELLLSPTDGKDTDIFTAAVKPNLPGAAGGQRRLARHRRVRV